jgi:hypothetical protein
MPNYRSLTGGFFSSTPMDKSTGPVTIRMNNPGAINGAPWEKTYPGYVDTVETTPGNRSTIFEAPEYGVGAWWDLLRRYRSANATTVGGIVNRYGGGQDYSAYIQFVVKATGFTPDTPIDLGNDQQVLQFGKAMFRYEAGRALPWTDEQILYGIRGGRAFANTGAWPVSLVAGAQQQQQGQVTNGQVSQSDLLALLQKLLLALATANSPAAKTASGAATSVGDGGQASGAGGHIPTPVILSPIDKLLGGQTLVGSKTMLGVIAYAVVTILKTAGVLGAATPWGQILPVLSIALPLLGGLAKVDRMTLSLGTIAANTK